jgi:hypothetical protein
MKNNINTSQRLRLMRPDACCLHHRVQGKSSCSMAAYWIPFRQRLSLRWHPLSAFQVSQWLPVLCHAAAIHRQCNGRLCYNE